MSKKAFDDLAQTLLSIKNQETMKRFLIGLLTKQELDDLPKRLQIIKMLKMDMTQREVSKKLGTGIATVTRGSKEIQKGNFENV